MVAGTPTATCPILPVFSGSLNAVLPWGGLYRVFPNRVIAQLIDGGWCRQDGYNPHTWISTVACHGAPLVWDEEERLC